MRILFTRHGESEANIQHVISNRDLPHKLTRLGIAQSLGLAEYLRRWSLSTILSSPVLRARETAEIISRALGIPFMPSPALREFDCGLMEGRGDDEAWAAHQAVTRAWDEDRDHDRHIPPDGESFNDMRARFLPLITDLTSGREKQTGDILLISHGGMLHQMLPLILLNVDRGFMNSHPLGNCALIETRPGNAGLFCISWNGIRSFD